MAKKSAGRTGGKFGAGRGSRGGAAAFAVGLFLAGPAAVAAADAGGEAAGRGSAPVGAEASSGSAQGPSRAGVTRSRTAPARSAGVGAGRAERRAPAAAAGVPRAASAVAGPARRAAAGAADSAPVVAVAADSADSAPSAVVAVTADSAPPPALTRTSQDAAAVVAAAVVQSPGAGPAAASAPAGAAAAPARLPRGAGVRAASLASPAVPSAAAARDQINSAVRQWFNTVEHWLSTLPNGPLVNIAEAALYLVRRQLFNQAPLVVPSQQSTSELDGTIGGRIGAFDLDGDTLTYEVLADGQYGTAVIDSDGVWTYTPVEGGGFVGVDSFTVRIAPATPSLNLFDFGGDGAREVTINVGESTYLDTPDIGVALFDASGRLTLSRDMFGQFTGTVTLNDVGPDTEWTWMDTSGLFGKVSTGHVEDFFPVLAAKSEANGAAVDLTLVYTAVDGSEHAVVLNGVRLGTDDDGAYVLSGRLAPDLEADPNGVDHFDIIGNHLAPREDDFRADFNLDGGLASFLRGLFSPSDDIEVYFRGAEVYLDTLTPLSYLKAGMYATDSEAQPQVVTEDPAVVQAADPTNLILGDAEIATSGVTAALSLGRSVVIGRADGSVAIWTDGKKETLQKPGGWGEGASVTSLSEYDGPLRDDQGNIVNSSFSGYIQGTTLTVTSLGPGSTVKVGSVITGEGVAPGTTIVKFIETKKTTIAGTKDDGCEGCTAQIRVGAGGSEGYTGTYEVSINQTVGSRTPDSDGTAPGITFTQTSVPAVTSGFVAGLKGGSVQLWQPATGWVELRGNSFVDESKEKITDVTHLSTLGGSIVVGDNAGGLFLWTPPDDSADVPSAWSDSRYWTTLQTPSKSGSAVTEIIEVGSPGAPGHGVFVAFAGTGGVKFWDSAGQRTDLFGTATSVTAATAYGNGVAIGFQNGSVYYWNGTIAQRSTADWTELKYQGWNQEISAIVPYENGLIVGLGGKDNPGAVHYYTGGTDYKSGVWQELHSGGWGAAVTQMIPYLSDARGDGVVVGLANGSVQMWNGLVKPPNATDTLTAGSSLRPGDALWSSNGGYRLTLQGDGNLVLRGAEKGELWASGTDGKEVVEASLQLDGNFVLYNKDGQSVTGTGQNDVKIPSATSGTNVRLVVQNDGNVVIYNPGGEPLWSTNTTQSIDLTDPEWRWWNELHDKGWTSAVTGLVPVSLSATTEGQAVFQQGLIVGLQNGAVEQWSGDGGQQDWVELVRLGGGAGASGALDDRGEFTCSNWRCTMSGSLKSGVEFAEALSAGGFSQDWGIQGGIGSDSDPIFKKPDLQHGSPVDGTYKAFAFYTKISPDAVNYLYPDPSFTFDGYVNLINHDGGDVIPDPGDRSILYVKQSSVKAVNVGSTVTPGIENVPGLGKLGLVTGYSVTNDPALLSLGTLGILGNERIQPGTTITEYLGTWENYYGDVYDKYQLSGLAQSPGCKDDECTDFAMVVTKSPSIKVGLDVIPVAYGYTYVPDGFFPKFKSANWSFGVMAALGGGAGVEVTLGPDGSLYGVEKDLVKTEYYNATPYGAVAAEAGVKLGANLTLNGLQGKSAVGAYAYVYGGALATFNTAGAQERFDYGFNWYPDINASDFADISGVSVTATVNPYANFSYGLFLPRNLPLVGGWSFAKVSLGYENPLYATVCVDGKQSCPSAGGAGVANVYGVINNGNFNGSTPEAGMGDILTVTQNAVFNPTKLAVGQVVTGQGVASGTKIKDILGSSANGDRYRVEQCDLTGCKPAEQLAIGGGGSAKLTAYQPGSNASITFGSTGLLTFHAGVLEAFTSALSYDVKVPLYDFNEVLSV